MHPVIVGLSVRIASGIQKIRLAICKFQEENQNDPFRISAAFCQHYSTVDLSW